MNFHMYACLIGMVLCVLEDPVSSMHILNDGHGEAVEFAEIICFVTGYWRVKRAVIINWY